MIKQVIKFRNGEYWCNYTERSFDINKAWTFNRLQGAENTIQINGLQNCGVIPVEVTEKTVTEHTVDA
jgi:hypothetical protein